MRPETSYLVRLAFFSPSMGKETAHNYVHTYTYTHTNCIYDHRALMGPWEASCQLLP